MEIKGIHIDLKAQMMKFDYLCSVIEDIAKLGFNTVLMEYQDKFPYSGKYSCFSSPDALTKEQVSELLSLCKSKNITVIPMVQCLGHMYWVTRYPGYDKLGEHYNEKGAGSHSLCASKSESVELFFALADEIMKLHPDCKYFHIGGDEVKFSEKCELCKNKTPGELLGAYYKKALAYVEKKGYTPVIWGDMIVKYSEISDMLPKNTVIMDWEYCRGLSEENSVRFYGKASALSEPDNTSFENTKKLIDKGFEVICAPSVRSMGDSTFIPRNVHLDNCVQAYYTAKALGAKGFIITSWAVRRIPWCLTEYILFAISVLMKDENATFDTVLSETANEYFNSENPELVKIPYSLAEFTGNAMKKANFLASGCDFMDAETGMFLPDPLEKRITVNIRNNVEVQRAYTDLALKASELSELLGENKGKCTQMLKWALENAKFYGELVSGLCENYENKEWLKKALGELECFEKKFEILGRYFTDFSMPSEIQTRTGVFKEYINNLLNA